MDVQRITRRENSSEIFLTVVFKSPYTNSIRIMRDIEDILRQNFSSYRLVNNVDKIKNGVLHSSFHIHK